ncbi:MAG: TonB-dependent receptor plug domain-containing protein [Methyloceanibacter sp.]
MRGASFASFGSIDPYGAERIEVLRGPASVLYGGGEPAGIINYISKRPTFDPYHGRRQLPAL